MNYRFLLLFSLVFIACQNSKTDNTTEVQEPNNTEATMEKEPTKPEETELYEPVPQRSSPELPAQRRVTPLCCSTAKTSINGKVRWTALRPSGS